MANVFDDDRIQASWKKKASEYLDIANERTRTMALGVIVVVWGIFTGKEAEELVLSPKMKTLLLWIAVGAVIALACELAEYFLGFLEARKYSVGHSTSGGVLNKLHLGTTSLKYFAGILAVALLVFSLVRITVDSVAQAAPNDFDESQRDVVRFLKNTTQRRAHVRFN